MAKIFAPSLHKNAKNWIWLAIQNHNKRFKERTQSNLLIVWQRGSFWFLPSFWGRKFLVKTKRMTTVDLTRENSWFKVGCRTPKLLHKIMYDCNQSHFIQVLRWDVFMKQNLRFGLLRQLRAHEFLVLFITFLSLHLV